MADSFEWDVFLSHSTKDKQVVHPLAERLKADGLRVWLDAWEVKAGDSIPAKIEEGLEHSRVLVLCMSAEAFGSDWARLESGTFRFRDPLNKERRFIPLRLDESPIKGSLAQFLYISWLGKDQGDSYHKLLEACRPLALKADPAAVDASEPAGFHDKDAVSTIGLQMQPPLVKIRKGGTVKRPARCLQTLKGHRGTVLSVCVTPDGAIAISGGADRTLRVWNLANGRCLRTLVGHLSLVYSVCVAFGGRYAASGSGDGTIRVWDLSDGRCLRTLEGHKGAIRSVSAMPDGSRVVSGGDDKTLRVWDLVSGRCLLTFEGHGGAVQSVSAMPGGNRVVSGSDDRTIRVWDLAEGRCLRTLEGHGAVISSVSVTPDDKRVVSGSFDRTIRVWDLSGGHCLRTLQGHKSVIRSTCLTPDGKFVVSGGDDRTIRVWDMACGRCLQILGGHTDAVTSLTVMSNGHRVVSGSYDKLVKVWGLSGIEWAPLAKGKGAPLSVATQTNEQYSNAKVLMVGDRVLGKSGVLNHLTYGIKVEDDQPRSVAQEYEQYTNAKVLLLGDSGVGKSGLSNYLAHGIKVEDDKPLPSTDGAWATHWPLTNATRLGGVEREIWLWDFAGQVDYRLVHQVFMDDTSAAVLVFNPQSENPFEGLSHWDQALGKAAGKPFVKLLAAGRIDRGGPVVEAESIQQFMDARGFRQPLHQTSAKTGEGCEGLRSAIIDSIAWENIPTTASPKLYHRLKQEILKLRDQGLVIIRLAELMQRMELTLAGEDFDLAQLETVIGLLAGPGMIQRLDFGNFVLLRPDVLSRYAAAVVRKVRQQPQGLGCISEDMFLAGELDYQDFQRLPADDEAVVLRALLDTFLRRAWCLRQPVGGTAILTFPSYFRRKRDEQPGHPNVLVTYRFDGPADEIYATLVVLLHHTKAFETTRLWKSAADFRTQSGAALGLALERENESTWRLEAYFAPEVDKDSQILFQRYVQEHLADNATNVGRLRRYYCANKKCRKIHEPFRDQATIDEALSTGGPGKVFCPACGKSILLRDVIEEKFVAPATQAKVQEMQLEGRTALDTESRELQAVHHVGFVVSEAGQIYRGYTNSDHGIDGEIEFKDDQGQATGQRLYVQIKSGDSYLRVRQHDSAEIFKISKPRWADYWQQQAYPVMLVIRASDGVIRWMDVSAYLKRLSAVGKQVKQIVFEGEQLDMMAVRRWRDKALGKVKA